MLLYRTGNLITPPGSNLFASTGNTLKELFQMIVFQAQAESLDSLRAPQPFLLTISSLRLKLLYD